MERRVLGKHVLSHVTTTWDLSLIVFQWPKLCTALPKLDASRLFSIEIQSKYCMFSA